MKNNQITDKWVNIGPCSMHVAHLSQTLSYVDSPVQTLVVLLGPGKDVSTCFPFSPFVSLLGMFV